MAQILLVLNINQSIFSPSPIQFIKSLLLQDFNQKLFMDSSLTSPKIDEEENKEKEFTLKIKQNDQIKILSRKLSILKEGVFTERNRKKELQQELQKVKSKMVRFEEENQRKEKKYEQLTIEIKKLKDCIIEERNKKHQLLEKINKKEKEQEGTSSGQQRKSNNLSLFGFGSLFSHQ